MSGLSKRSFLLGRFNEQTHIRPPGSEPELVDLCTKCGKCAEACPTGIIVLDDRGVPAVDLNEGPCLFCSKCADVCEPEAIKPATGWSVRPRLLPSCLSNSGVACRTCEDQCEAQAIRFRLMTGGRSVPHIDMDACVGCGSCASACPVKSIEFHEQTSAEGTPC